MYDRRAPIELEGVLLVPDTNVLLKAASYDDKDSERLYQTLENADLAIPRPVLEETINHLLKKDYRHDALDMYLSRAVNSRADERALEEAVSRHRYLRSNPLVHDAQAWLLAKERALGVKINPKSISIEERGILLERLQNKAHWDRVIYAHAVSLAAYRMVVLVSDDADLLVLDSITPANMSIINTGGIPRCNGSSKTARMKTPKTNSQVSKKQHDTPSAVHGTKRCRVGNGASMALKCIITAIMLGVMILLVAFAHQLDTVLDVSVFMKYLLIRVPIPVMDLSMDVEFGRFPPIEAPIFERPSMQSNELLSKLDAGEVVTGCTMHAIQAVIDVRCGDLQSHRFLSLAVGTATVADVSIRKDGHDYIVFFKGQDGSIIAYTVIAP